MADPTVAASVNWEQLFGNLIAAAAVAILALANWLKGRVRDKDRADRAATTEQLFGRLEEKLDKRFDQVDDRFTAVEERITEVDRRVTEVKGICVGVDGENGLRKDIADMSDEVKGLVKRERDRLERAIGIPDRRVG